MKTTATTPKSVKKDALNFIECNNLYSLLTQKGFDSKKLKNDTYLNIHWLKFRLAEWIKEINESISELAKEMKHEIVPTGNGGAIFMKVKDEGGKDDGYEKASKEFIDRKIQLENVKLEGLKLNFMKIEEFREWAGNLDNQFELSPFLLEK